MDLETRRKISQTMKGHSNFEGKRHSHATKLQIGFSQEGHKNAKDHKWATDKESGEEHRVKGKLPKGLRWGRKSSLGEGEVWDSPSPSKKPNKLSAVMKARAKARAKSAGRPYPNMVDNMWAAKNEETMLDEMKHKATHCGRCGTTHVPPKFGGKCPALKEEQVNELKKSTLSSYLDKTVDPVHGMPRSADKLKQRLAGIQRAVKRTVGKMNEVRSEYSKAAHDDDQQAFSGKPPKDYSKEPVTRTRISSYKDREGNTTHEVKQTHGKTFEVSVSKHDSKEAAQKARAEIQKKHGISEEEVVEVSKPALGRYIEKAATSMSTAAFGQGQASASRRPPSEKDQKTGFKRMVGIARATSRLTKEATDPIPFEGPYTKSKETEKDKSGAVHTPMSRARHLARLAMKAKKLKDSQ